MASNQPFRLPVVSGQTYSKKTVQLDGTRFENCKFIDCQILYDGGPAETSACYFSPGTAFFFRGIAANVVQVIQGLGWTILPP